MREVHHGDGRTSRRADAWEGGDPFGTEMPAFKDRLTEEQIWQIIAYMRAGFPRNISDR